MPGRARHVHIGPQQRVHETVDQPARPEQLGKIVECHVARRIAHERVVVLDCGRAHRARAARRIEDRGNLPCRAAAEQCNATGRDRRDPARDRLWQRGCLSLQHGRRTAARGECGQRGANRRGRQLRDQLLKIDQRLHDRIDRGARPVADEGQQGLVALINVVTRGRRYGVGLLRLAKHSLQLSGSTVPSRYRRSLRRRRHTRGTRRRHGKPQLMRQRDQ